MNLLFSKELSEHISNNKSSRFFYVPFAMIQFTELREITWIAWHIKETFENSVDWSFQICYYKTSIVFINGGQKMQSKLTVEIPYGTRSRYLDVICKINELVSDDGACVLFVNNSPYCLEAYLVIETSGNFPEIQECADKHNLKIVTDKGLEELLKEQAFFRKYDSVSLPHLNNRRLVSSIIKKRFMFSEEEAIKSKGYNNTEHIRRKKLFISYSHSDKIIVYDIIKQLRQSGANCWIDEKDIEVGQHLLESVLSGINESDLAILFISNAFRNSNFAKLELNTIMSAMMKKQLGWYNIKLDDVCVDDILPSLSDYKYYDFAENNNIDDLISDISKRIKNLK